MKTKEEIQAVRQHAREEAAKNPEELQKIMDNMDPMYEISDSITMAIKNCSMFKSPKVSEYWVQTMLLGIARATCLIIHGLEVSSKHPGGLLMHYADTMLPLCNSIVEEELADFDKIPTPDDTQYKS